MNLEVHQEADQDPGPVHEVGNVTDHVVDHVIEALQKVYAFMLLISVSQFLALNKIFYWII